jgi:hypothetical protein
LLATTISNETFAWKEERTVSMNLTLQYDQVLFILEPSGIARSLVRRRVTVIDYPDGRLSIRYNGIDLAYRTIDKRPQMNQAAIVENKRPGPDPGLYCRAAKEAGYVPISQDAAATRSEKPYVQGWLASAPRAARCATHAPRGALSRRRIQPLTQRKAANLSQPSDISKWSKS